MFEEVGQVATDAIRSIRTVASFTAEEKVMEIYRRKYKGPMSNTIKQGLVGGVSFGLSNTLLFCVYATAFYAGAMLIKDGKTTFSDVFCVSLFFPLRKLVLHYYTRICLIYRVVSTCILTVIEGLSSKVTYPWGSLLIRDTLFCISYRSSSL